jgi:hypothetical protein
VGLGQNCDRVHRLTACILRTDTVLAVLPPSERHLIGPKCFCDLTVNRICAIRTRIYVFDHSLDDASGGEFLTRSVHVVSGSELDPPQNAHARGSCEGMTGGLILPVTGCVTGQD